MHGPTQDGAEVEFLYRAHIDVEGFYEVGETFRGTRTIVRVKGGWFEGPRLKGEILPGTGDWFIVRPGGVAEGRRARHVPHARRPRHLRELPRHHRHAAPEIWERLGRGEDVDPYSEYYCAHAAHVRDRRERQSLQPG